MAFIEDSVDKVDEQGIETGPRGESGCEWILPSHWSAKGIFYQFLDPFKLFYPMVILQATSP